MPASCTAWTPRPARNTGTTTFSPESGDQPCGWITRCIWAPKITRSSSLPMARRKICSPAPPRKGPTLVWARSCIALRWPSTAPSTWPRRRNCTLSVRSDVMVARSKNLWNLVLDQQFIDPDDLAEAIRDQVISEDLDFRTRLLIRDGTNALEKFWGSIRWRKWLRTCPVRDRIKSICSEDLGKAGFPFLRNQLMEPTKPDTVNQLFRELGQSLHEPIKLVVGGSVALIMPGYLARQTQDVDVVDEIPSALRSQPKLLDEVQKRYRLQLAHFQSHYLPAGFAQRLH